jgi:hypothetical protein
MSKIEVLGSQAPDSADWNHAWNVVSQLAAARGTTLRELGEDRNGAVPGTPIDQRAGADSGVNFARAFAPITPDQLTRDITEIEQAAATLRWAEPQSPAPVAPDQLARDMAEIEQAAATLRWAEPQSPAPVEPDQIARDMAEIEQAAAALRQAEPTLERRAPETPAVEAPASRSVWPLVCVIWLTALLVVSSAIGAIVLLVG